MITQENIPYTADEIKAMVKTCEKYNKALERMKSWARGEHPECFSEAQKAAEFIFPELKESESEDERIRKTIIRILKGEIGYTSKGDIDKYVTWLEKQGKKKLTDKVEPKFHEGDFITNDYCLGKVIGITNDAYLLDTGQGVPFSCEHNAHLWTIQDAKDGDVLVDSYSKDSLIILYKGINKEQSILAHCGWNGYNFSIKTNGLGYGGLDNTNYLPATKEQRDLLFSKMKEAGCEWDADKKELKKIEVASKESKDERIRKEIIDFVKSRGGFKGDWLAWLEKQKKQKHFSDFNADDWYVSKVDGKIHNAKFIKFIEKQDEEKSIDEVGPKFKVGDWITDGHLICKVLSVTGKSYELHLYNDDYCHFETDVKSIDKYYHLWTIKDTKEGNILVPEAPKEGGQE